VRGAPNGAPGPGAPRRSHPALRAAQYALAVAAVIFIAVALADSWDSVQAYDWTLRVEWLAASAAAFLGFYVLQGYAWQLLLRAVGLHAPTLWAIASWSRSILARYVPGNVFMIVGRVLACQRRGLSARRVSAAMVYEQALGFCAALVTLGLLLPFSEYRRGTVALSLIAIPVILALLHPRVFGPLADRLLALARREPLGTVLGFGSVLRLLCYYVACWFVAGLGCWALVRGVTASGVGLLPVVTAAFALAYVAGMVAFVFPGGIGVREAVLAAALGGELGAGVALAWALLLRLWIIAVELVFAGLATLAERRKGAPPGVADGEGEHAGPGVTEG
jgi:uncharacterized membrane protein YbhN (UPF0104 family)